MFSICIGARAMAPCSFSKSRIFWKTVWCLTTGKQRRSIYLGLKESFEEVKAEEKSISLYEPWEICQLKSNSDVVQAQALLYQTYINEMGWMFAKDNPTGFRIETSPCGKRLLTDDLESHSSFFGVKFQGEVIAVIRRVNRDRNGHLDVTRYESSKKPAIQKLICPSYSPNLVELQRCAVMKPYRGTNVTPCLFHYVFDSALREDCAIIGTSPVGKMKSFLASTLKIPIIDHNFLYSENIEGPSACFFLSNNILQRTVGILERVIQCSKYSNK